MLNGKEYDGIEAMPPDVRKDYEALLESLKNTGGEDVLSVLKSPGHATIKTTTTVRQIVVNGKSYGSVEEMPAETRRIYEEAMARMAAGTSAEATRPPRPSQRTLRPPVVVEEDRPSRVGGVLRTLFWMGLGALIALWVVRRWHLQL